MAIEIQNIHRPQEGSLLSQVGELNAAEFGAVDQYFSERVKNREDLLLTVATAGDRVIGYKMGYRDESDRFYSWLGTVHADYRRQGVASKLMEWQHAWCKEHGYQTIRTKTKNKWRSMLLLNIKSGFDVIGTYTDDKGEPKIILEKKL